MQYGWKKGEEGGAQSGRPMLAWVPACGAVPDPHAEIPSDLPPEVRAL